MMVTAGVVTVMVMVMVMVLTVVVAGAVVTDTCGNTLLCRGMKPVPLLRGAAVHPDDLRRDVPLHGGSRRRLVPSRLLQPDLPRLQQHM